ncbi:tetratricopeptide repeat (TPR)-like superfamily protein [Citrus sinensis]|uniref:Tetratricopeptide repeat (TPR)-like superfamily protein n=2 Tax=Citrus sinensis TaxID=2711 RepID=A0ACB8NIB4_CITSI|nr:tetratricopeptide repeat (TPR)-like superfamily protein [Citrus sinensis]
MEVQISNLESLSAEPNSPVGFGKQGLEEFIAEGSLDFDEWTSLLSEIENSCPDDIEMIGLVYDSFLAEFPLCYGYWRKYADHKARLCSIDKVVEVFERAVQSATYSVDVWFHYCSLSMSTFEDPNDVRSRLFKRALSFVGKDYLCHTMWDKYIEFEISQQRWSSLAQIFVQTLRFPSKKLHHYYDSFKKLAGAWKEELECESDSAMEFQSELVLEGEVPAYYKDDETSSVIKDLLDPSVDLVRSKAIQKYRFIGEQIYKEASQLDEKINCFENLIRRPYFHVKPLDDIQLKNWHDYLSFAEKQGDFDWVVKLYERCLIPCADYPEFWMRYVDFMESKGGREIASYALDRATQIFLKRLPVIHLFNARYKEQIGDTSAARAAFPESYIDSDSRFIEKVTFKANMERRLGNFVAACDTYKEALETAAEQRKFHTLPLLYVQFSRLTYTTTGSADNARDILIDGIKHVPNCKLLLEELIKFTMVHGGRSHISIVDAVISNALYSRPDVLKVFSLEDVEDISSLYLQFLDLCGTIHDIRNAWNQHIKLFPHTVRTAYECPGRETKSLRAFIRGKRESNVASPPQPFESEHLMPSASQDKKFSPPEKSDSESGDDATSLPSNQKSPLPENHDIRSDGAEVDILLSGEADSSSQDRMQQVPPEAAEQHSQDACDPEVLSLDLAHQVTNENETVQASEAFSEEDDVQREYEHESKKDLKPLSLEGLSLDPGGNDSPGSLCATSHECEAPQKTNFSHESMLKSEAPRETSLSDGSVLGASQNNNGSHFAPSSMGTQASSSAPIQTRTVSPSSSASHQNFIPEAHSHPQTPANSGRNWHEQQNPDRVHRDLRFGYRGHSHKRQHQQRRFSSQRYPRNESGDQMPMNSRFPSQPLPSQNPQAQQGSQAQSQFLHSLTAQAWPMQNMQQQTFASASQSEVPAQPVFYPQAQMSQYPSQSSEQQGLLQSNLAYNQMWQYYYYQQQQQQQLFLQQQHLQLQQQHLQPHQQQQFVQQQQYQQQHSLYLQQQPQHQQLEQYQMQQQVQQQDQHPPQQWQLEQRQSEQQIGMSQIEKWNNNSSKQDQGVAPPNTAATTPAASPSLHLQ